MIRVSGRVSWTGAQAALVLAKRHPLAADSWVPGSHKQHTRIYSHHATKTANAYSCITPQTPRSPCIPNVHCFSSEKERSSRVHANDDTCLNGRVPPFHCFRMALVYHSYPMHPKINPKTWKAQYVQRQPRNLTTKSCSVVCVVCRPSYVGTRKLSRSILEGLQGPPQGCQPSPKPLLVQIPSPPSPTLLPRTVSFAVMSAPASSSSFTTSG